MLIRSSIAIVLLAALAPAYSFAQEEESRVRCGEQYMTLMVTGGETLVEAGPLTVRKSDVRAIYVAYGDKLTLFIDIGKTILRPTIDPKSLRPILECLD